MLVIFTAPPIRAKTRETGGVIFSLQHVSEDKPFGTKVVWRGQIKVGVFQTMLDILSDPLVGGWNTTRRLLS